MEVVRATATTRTTGTALLLVLLTGLASAAPSRCELLEGVSPERLRRYDAIILRESERRGLNPRLVKAIIAAESQFSPRARSPRGARGLMQVMPATAREVGFAPAALADPETNVRAGTEYLSRLYAQARRSGRAPGAPAPFSRRVIAAYHAGPRALGAGWWPESTRRYVRTVVDCYRAEASAVRPLEFERTARLPGEAAR